ncbi:protein FAR1-RELATED SEQUENCE 3-like [Bidens hawaiensis]|uniref:protein FAR1-RELATED SEQUENCE 3-like n=1 Tax=Bidens hawaiensis TaxID=980011 RepID=UPI004049D4F9
MAEDMDTEIEDNIAEDITVRIEFIPAVSSSIKPVEGMTFPSLDASYQFYVEYANKGGVSVRKDSQTEKNEYGGFDDVGVTVVDCKNFKRNINCYIGEFDAEMIVQRLLNKKEYLPDFSFYFTVDESGCLTGLFWADKVGPVLCNNEHFKRHICNIVWTDSIEPDEFEMKWHEIVNEFGLIDNSWISTMFGLRSMWIPAYYRDESLSGLLRTTSRSESENQFFGLVSNSQLTLVEFFSHFNMDLETQRYAHRKNDHDTRNTKPDGHGPNATIYVKDKEAFGKGCIQVSVIVDDNDFSASCSCKSCKRFEQYGLLCWHVFVAFRVLEIDEIPKKYILRRWMRDAISVKRKCSIFGKDVANGNIDKDEIVRDIMFAIENICNMFFPDIEELSKVRDQINGIRGKAEEGSQAKPILKKNDMLASLLGYDQPSTSTIRVPNGIRNKGRDSHKRIKSLKEIAASRIGKRSRTCLV